MITVNVPETALRIVALREAEIRLRERARRLELNPFAQAAARDLFRQASGLRRARLALIERCGLN